METLQITLFGHISVIQPNSSVPLKLTRSTQALLVYLLLQKQLVSRDVLIDVFLVNYSPERARSSLTTAIWRLRQLLEPSDIRPGTYLITNHTGGVGFNWESNHWLDTKLFEQSICPFLRKPLLALNEDDIKQIEDVLSLYRGPLLEGMYEDWALREREHFHSLHVSCLTRLMKFYADRNHFESSIAYGHEILRRDPLREEIHRNLMRIYLESGQRALAIRQYVQYRELLSQELGVPPLEETETLYQQIVTSSHPGAPTGGQPLTQEITQLAHELRLVKRSLDETTRALGRITQAVSHLTYSSETAPGISRRQRR